MNTDPIEVGERIRNIRKNQLGISMAEFGSRIDSKAKSGTVSNWETGKNLPNNERLKRIAKLAGISIDELLYGSIDSYIEKVLSEDIRDNGIFFNKVIEYLSYTTDLLDVEDTLFLDDEEQLLTQKEMIKRLFYMKQDVAFDYLKKNLFDIIEYIKKNDLRDFDEDEVINLATSYVSLQYAMDMSTFKGQYFNYKKIIKNIVPSVLGNPSFEKLKDLYVNMYDISESEANKKAVDALYQDKLYNISSEFKDEIDKLYLAYLKELSKYE